MRPSASAFAYFLLVSSFSSPTLGIKSPKDIPTLPSKISSRTRSSNREDTRKPMSYSHWTLKCTDVPQYDALEAAAASFRSDDKLHLRNLCNDSSRCAGLKAEHHDSRGCQFILDYSRQQVTGEVMELLFDLADAVNFVDRREAMRQGARINSTEMREVLHHCLRMPRGYNFSMRENPNNNNGKAGISPFSQKGAEDNGQLILQKIHAVQDQIAAFTDKVRSGQIRGATGKRLKNYVCIGIGGSKLGAEFVNEAFRADPVASEASHGRILRFLSNVDPVEYVYRTIE
jgi:glucose-6-phosphate isomerase